MSAHLLEIYLVKVNAQQSDTPIRKLPHSIEAGIQSGVRSGQSLNRVQAQVAITMAYQQAASPPSGDNSGFTLEVTARAEYEWQETPGTPENFDRDTVFELCHPAYIVAAQEVIRLARQIGILNLTFPMQFKLGEKETPSLERPMKQLTKKPRRKKELSVTK